MTSVQDIPICPTAESEVDKAYRCANDMYQCFKEYKNGRRTVSSNNASSTAAAPTGQDAIEQVKQLKELLDMGALTPDEFEKKKKELLNL